MACVNYSSAEQINLSYSKVLEDFTDAVSLNSKGNNLQVPVDQIGQMNVMDLIDNQAISPDTIVENKSLLILASET